MRRTLVAPCLPSPTVATPPWGDCCTCSRSHRHTAGEAFSQPTASTLRNDDDEASTVASVPLCRPKIRLWCTNTPTRGDCRPGLVQGPEPRRVDPPGPFETSCSPTGCATPSLHRPAARATLDTHSAVAAGQMIFQLGHHRQNRARRRSAPPRSPRSYFMGPDRLPQPHRPPWDHAWRLSFRNGLRRGTRRNRGVQGG